MSGVRRIDRLRWARPCAPPGFPSNPHLRGKKAAGLRYERALAEAIPRSVRGQWFEFEDQNGHGYCQPDVLLQHGAAQVIFEAKLSMTLTALVQLEHLYCPVVERAFGGRAVGIIVTRHLRGIEDQFKVVASLEEAISVAKRGRRVVLHWLGIPAQLQEAA